MTSLFRNSRPILTRVACFRRSAATTTTPSGGTGVRPSGTSNNLSETSRAADGTDMAMRDAKQRATNPKSTGGQSNTPNTGTSSNQLGKIGFAVVLTAAAYFAYVNYIKNTDSSKNLGLNKGSANTQSADHGASTGKKH